jgi:hypothetical protein
MFDLDAVKITQRRAGSKTPVIYVSIRVLFHVERGEAVSFALLHQQWDDIWSGLL